MSKKLEREWKMKHLIYKVLIIFMFGAAVAFLMGQSYKTQNQIVVMK